MALDSLQQGKHAAPSRPVLPRDSTPGGAALQGPSLLPVRLRSAWRPGPCSCPPWAGPCRFIDYQNPRMVVGCIVQHEGKILLCRRGIEPQRGLWTVPAGACLDLGFDPSALRACAAALCSGAALGG